MRMKTVLALALFLVFGVVRPALANQPPGPHVMLSEVFILPVMIVLSLFGGAYAVLATLYPKRRTVARWLGAILAILLSGVHEGFGLLVALIFGIIALERGLRMIGWGQRVRPTEINPEHLAKANRWRLVPAGVLLVVVTLFLMGMAVAFVGYWPSFRAAEGERRLRAFVAIQRAYARLEKSRTGSVRFRRLRPGDDEEYFFRYVRVEYGADEKSFTAYVLPGHFPFFPYNYLTSQPCYRGDESGQIRMIYVHRREERCPADAPVVFRVADLDLQEMLRDNDWKVRRHAAFLLGELKDPDAVERLIAALKDGSTAVRSEVAEALGRITGVNFGEDLGAWQKWWGEHRQTAPAGK